MKPDLKALLFLLPLIAACDDGLGPQPVPDFNYIPLNDDVCVPESDEDLATAAQTIADRIAANPDWYAAVHFEVCSEEQLSACSPCAVEANPLLGVLRSADTLGSDEVQTALEDGTVPMPTLEDYFRVALAYEWRDLVVSHASDGTVTLAQGIRFECEDGLCGYLASESLDPTCEAFSHELDGELGGDGNTLTLDTSPGDEAFGFVVPLMPNLPASSSFETDADLRDYLLNVPVQDVRMHAPELDYSLAEDRDGELAGCGQLVGYIETSDFNDLVSDPATLTQFETDRPGFIKAVLTTNLAPMAITAPELP